MYFINFAKDQLKTHVVYRDSEVRIGKGYLGLTGEKPLVGDLGKIPFWNEIKLKDPTICFI